MHSVLCALGWPLGAAWACKVRVGLSVLSGQECVICSPDGCHSDTQQGLQRVSLISHSICDMRYKQLFQQVLLCGFDFMPARCTL